MAEIYTVKIEDAACVAGITAARNAYNSGLADDQSPLLTDQEYVQFVMANAAMSYCVQYGTG